jgi:hypothetical protein
VRCEVSFGIRRQVSQYSAVATANIVVVIVIDEKKTLEASGWDASFVVSIP